MEEDCGTKMARLVPLLLVFVLFVIIIISSDGEVRLSSSEVDGGDPVCDITFDLCKGSCWKSGKCLSCCQYHGFVHGKCKLKDGDACYCCHDPDQKFLNFHFQSLPPSP